MSTLGDLQVGDAQLAECAVNEVIAISRHSLVNDTTYPLKKIPVGD